MAPGPAPKHPSVRARRNDAKKDFTVLPLHGREGAAPRWPLSQDISSLADKSVADNQVEHLEQQLATEEDGRKRRTILKQLEKAQGTSERMGLFLATQSEQELALWEELWATPQAVEWERAHAFRAVALFVRWSIKAEAGNIEATKEARMWSDRLGLNPLALQRLRQEVENAGAAEERGRERRERTAKAPAKKAASAKGRKADPRAALSIVS